MSDKQMKSKAICILGMHRSGTSTITRAINLLGAYLGEEQDLMPSTEYNAEGYWERNDIFYLQDRILEKFGRSWDTVEPLPEQWHLSEEIQPFKEELRELIGQNFSNRQLWAWKDPRTCILLPLWKLLLDELGVELSCVFVVRNPLDVANSLKKRDGIPLDKSFGIWFNYNATALHYLPGVRTVFVSYDRFLEDCENELRRCAADLEIEWPEEDADLRELLRSSLRTDLRHSLSNISALQGAPSPVQNLYELLVRVLEAPSSNLHQFFENIDQLYGAFVSYATFFEAQLAALRERNQQVSDALQERNQQMTKLRTTPVLRSIVKKIINSER